MRNIGLVSCLFGLSLVPGVESSFLRRGDDGSLEFEMDLAELPQQLRQLNEIDTSEETPADGANLTAREMEIERLISIDGPIGREYEYEEDSNPGLLNEVIQVFLPYINRAFQNAIPDPFDIPLRGSFNLPQIDLLGYCKADAGFNVSLGTMTGMSGLNIQRMQVFAGTEEIDASWNVNRGCLQTLFSAYFDLEIASDRVFSIDDLSGGIHAKVCSYGVDEYVSGGILTVAPRMRGAMNISGEIIGTQAKLKFADMRKSLKIGYEHIEGYLNGASDSVNEAVKNITAELSILAKERVLNFIMRDELVDSVTPEVRSRARQSVEGQEYEFDTPRALEYNTKFMRNQMSDESVANVEAAVTGTLNFFQRMGFTWRQDGGN